MKNEGASARRAGIRVLAGGECGRGRSVTDNAGLVGVGGAGIKGGSAVVRLR